MVKEVIKLEKDQNFGQDEKVSEGFHLNISFHVWSNYCM